MKRKILFGCCLLSCCLTLLGGCNTQTAETKKYETIAVDPNRNTELARQYNAAAVMMIKDDDIINAEYKLKSALNADMFFGPAHNNLGLVYYKSKRFYLAAWEFQYATKLMPNEEAPRNNLGMVMEAVTKLDDAAKWYEKALTIKPGSVESTANLARVRLRQKKHGAKTQKLLRQIVLKDDRAEWVSWAKERLAMIPTAKTIEKDENKSATSPLTFHELLP